MAELQDFACLTGLRKRIPLGLSECSLCWTLKKIDQRGFPDISQVMLCIDEVITREKVSVVFDDGNIAAGLPKDAQRMLLPQCRPGNLFKDLHVNLLDILRHPLVEDGAEKITESFSGDCARTDATLFFWLWFNEREKLDIASLELLEESVNLGGVLDVLCMHHAQDV